VKLSQELLDRLHRAAWALCGSVHDAEHLVQETLAGVLARPRRRLPLVAVDVVSLSQREAARALDVREPTIGTRVFRARQQLALALTADAADV
jgi:DNA-directed RNA polymerase specialized sigma24 family protein